MGEALKRNKYHTQLKRFLNTADGHLKTPLTLYEANECKIRVEEIFAKFEEIQDVLEETAQGADARVTQEEAGQKVEDTFCEVRGKLRNIINELSVTTTCNPTPTTTPALEPNLPAIPLPTFDGKFSEWLSFSDQWKSAVGNNSRITSARKLQYLKGVLIGEPLQLIANFSITDSNYSPAWQTLKERYDDKQKIKRAYFNKILDFKPVKTCNAKELQALIDNTTTCLLSLDQIGWTKDDLLNIVIERKLDSDTRGEWAKTLARQLGSSNAALAVKPTTYDDLRQFVQEQIICLQAAASINFTDQINKRVEKQLSIHYATTDGQECALCDGPHGIGGCSEFLEKSAGDRSQLARRHRLCFNCLGKDHMIRDCPSPRKCKKCGNRHHTLLHEDRSGDRSKQKETPSASSSADPPTFQSAHVVVKADEAGLLMTAIAHIENVNGGVVPVRVLIDQGSEGDFITTSCSKKLGIRSHPAKVRVKGVQDTDVPSASRKVEVTLISPISFQELNVELLLLDKITGKIPSTPRKRNNWLHLTNLKLADDHWNEPGDIDILLGAKYFDPVILGDRKRGPTGTPTAWETIFGWCVTGICPPEQPHTIGSFAVTLDMTDNILRRFWEVEEPPKHRILTAEEKSCEQHFLNSYKRVEGRFLVRVPFIEEKKKKLGYSRAIAIRRLKQVERRLQKKPELQLQYAEFMREYRELGHMVEIPAHDATEVPGKTNFLCHHFVVNDSSTTTKLRVVFDGSASTSSGISLNETMLVGATLQDDIYDLLLRFRVHNIVLKADIAKMFRQFMLDEEDACMHRILWRESPNEEVKVYQLNTVTYGTACAPNLATRCVQQLGSDALQQYPMASLALTNDTYVDDVLTGVGTEEEAMKLFHQLREATATAHLDLRKWCSNSRKVMEKIPEELREKSQVLFDEGELVKALGVQWHPVADEFRFKAVEFQAGVQTTKRSLLAELARVFDPLGFISCVTLRGKLLLQELWRLPLEWDDVVPDSTQATWESYKTDLALLPQLSIPRQITVKNAVKLEIHGFGDSSEAALGSIVYLRSVDRDGNVIVRFVTSKTRVAPVRQSTLPRLELCAAVLTAELVVHVKETLQMDADLYFWSDSTIALTWIASSPRRWKTYVANRVATIQELTVPSSWRHVAGKDNPADLASRGCSVENILISSMWWEGPSWLTQPELPIFEKPDVTGDLEEKLSGINCGMVELSPEESPILTRFSTLERLKRVTAWYIRWLHWKSCIRRGSPDSVVKGPLRVEELKFALVFWVKHIQDIYFKDEIKRLKQGKEINCKSQLKHLCPFIDQHGVLRVSGRLKNAAVSDVQKYQIIIPGTSHLAGLLVDQYHKINAHSGFQLTWSTLQREYWMIGGRNKVRFAVRSCIRCRRYKHKVASQLMGSLPAPRVTPSRPFTHTGVDYAGPFSFKNPIGRAPKVYKGYMCVFICFATKAVHLEAVSSLSTEGFLAALRRFVSRRGLVRHMHSDCGTNFIGADKELKRFMTNHNTNDSISADLASHGIDWHFNPPSAPHFGGLWEAAVKSAKHHLRRVMGSSPVTFEQFITLLAQIEAVLNSRPLGAMSSEPGDLEPLTPGHFLIGAPLNAVPDQSLAQMPANRLSHFQRIQQQFQQFWKRWSQEYLNTLQQRNKWVIQEKNVAVDDLVLIVEEAPPGTWKMGRVQAVHPSDDGRVRVVTVTTATGLLKRAISKIIPLLLKTD